MAGGGPGLGKGRDTMDLRRLALAAALGMVGMVGLGAGAAHAQGFAIGEPPPGTRPYPQGGYAPRPYPNPSWGYPPQWGGGWGRGGHGYGYGGGYGGGYGRGYG